MLSNSLGNTLMGTEQYDRVMAAATHPLGHSAVRECREMLSALARDCEVHFDLRGVLDIEQRFPAASLDDVAKAIADFKQDELACGAASGSVPPATPRSPVAARTPTGAHTPNRGSLSPAKVAGSRAFPSVAAAAATPASQRNPSHSGFNREDSMVAGGGGDAAARRRTMLRRHAGNKSVADLSTLANLNASATFLDPLPVDVAGKLPQPPASPKEGSEDSARSGAAEADGANAVCDETHLEGFEAAMRRESAEHALRRGFTNAQWLLLLCQHMLRELGLMHHTIARNRASWEWLQHRSPFARTIIAAASLTLSELPKAFTLVPERALSTSERAHKALTYLRILEAHVTEGIGVVHAAIVMLQNSVESAREEIDLSSAGSGQDASAQADLLEDVAEQLADSCRSVMGRIRKRFAGANARRAPDSLAPEVPPGETAAGIAGQRCELLLQVESIAAALCKWLSEATTLLGRLDQHRVPTATQRLRRAAALGTLYGVIWGVRRYGSALTNAQVPEALAESFRAYFVDPALSVIEGLLTVQPRQDADGIQRERTALTKMVVDYHQDQRTGGGGMSAEEVDNLRAAVEHGDLGRVTDDYVDSMRSPLYALVRGRLTRLLLIQVQQQKVDVDDIMLRLNAMLAQNDLTMRVMACMPFAILTYFARRAWRRRRRAALRPIYADMRVCWWTLHRIMCGINTAAPAPRHHAEPTTPARIETRAPGSHSASGESDGELAAAGPSNTEDTFEHLHTMPGSEQGRESLKRSGRPAAMSFGRRVRSMSFSIDGGDDESRHSSAGAATVTSWGGELTPYELGQVLLQVHALRALASLAWPSRVSALRTRFLTDLHDLEAVGGTRKARLHVLNRMGVAYSFLRASDDDDEA